MIPKLGKLFVFFNVAVALALVTWSVSLTSNRLDWIDKPEGFNAADENPYAADTNNLERLENSITSVNKMIIQGDKHQRRVTNKSSRPGAIHDQHIRGFSTNCI